MESWAKPVRSVGSYPTILLVLVWRKFRWASSWGLTLYRRKLSDNVFSHEKKVCLHWMCVCMCMEKEWERASLGAASRRKEWNGENPNSICMAGSCCSQDLAELLNSVRAGCLIYIRFCEIPQDISRRMPILFRQVQVGILLFSSNRILTFGKSAFYKQTNKRKK